MFEISLYLLKQTREENENKEKEENRAWRSSNKFYLTGENHFFEHSSRLQLNLIELPSESNAQKSRVSTVDILISRHSIKIFCFTHVGNYSYDNPSCFSLLVVTRDVSNRNNQRDEESSQVLSRDASWFLDVHE